MKKKTPSKKKAPPPRRSVRFTPDPLTIAGLSLKNEKVFRPSIIGLVLNESFGGCSVLVNHDPALKKDQVLSIKVGHLGVMKAKVVWVKNLEESVYKIGLKFIED